MGATEREKFLEKRILEIEEKFRQIQESISFSQKGKGRGKKSKTKPSEDNDISQQINEVFKHSKNFLVKICLSLFVKNILAF